MNGDKTVIKEFKYGTFKGEVIDGKLYQGELFYKSGTKFVGTFKDNLPHVGVKFDIKKGHEFTGEFRNRRIY